MLIADPLQPAISIEQFFQMTGIRFMDELTMPRPRRSTVGPGQLRARARRRSSAAEDLGASAAEEEPIPLSEFAIAMAVDMPRIDLYTAITRDLTAYIAKCKKIYEEAEEEALKDTPSLFREFASVDESEQAMLILRNSYVFRAWCVLTGEGPTASTEAHQSEQHRQCQVPMVRLEVAMGRATVRERVPGLRQP